MKPAPHGTINGYQRPYACRCLECVKAAAAYRRRGNIRRAQRSAVNRYQAGNKEGGNRGKLWTSREFALATERDERGGYARSARSVALEIDRSVLAVERARSKARRDA